MSDDGPLFSSYAGDEDMLELVEMFVEELPDRIRALDEALAAGDPDPLRVLAHQLKGSAGSYGFQSITEAAARLEQCLKDGGAPDEVKGLHAELVHLLDRATAEPQT